MATAHRLRKERCQEVADSSMTQFTEQVKEAKAPLVVHFDGEESLPVFTVTQSIQVRFFRRILTARLKPWTGS